MHVTVENQRSWASLWAHGPQTIGALLCHVLVPSQHARHHCLTETEEATTEARVSWIIALLHPAWVVWVFLIRQLRGMNDAHRHCFLSDLSGRPTIHRSMGPRPRQRSNLCPFNTVVMRPRSSKLKQGRCSICKSTATSPMRHTSQMQHRGGHAWALLRCEMENPRDNSFNIYSARRAARPTRTSNAQSAQAP
jgi:hypothetical protein